MTTYSHDATLSPAYILHTRKYRDTSLIAEFLTERDGRVTAVIRGARSGRKKTGVVQPFTPVLVSYFGRGELKTVSKLDIGGVNQLVGENIMIGLYVNELLVRLLGKYDPVVELFSAYQELLLVLVSGNPATALLRRFELLLLSELGYGITFDADAGTGMQIESDCFYRYVPDEGFHQLKDTMNRDTNDQGSFKGEHLLAIAGGELDSPDVDASAKKIIRSSLTVLLGHKPLKSREMFELYQSEKKQ